MPKAKVNSSLPSKRKEMEEESGETEKKKIKPFPVVGIGASAGGLEAFTQLLEALPDNTGMAFVLIQHLDPKHESILTALLSRHTTMRTSQVTKEMLVEPNHVYVIPPNASMTIENGRLELTARTLTGRGVHMPVDVFLRSLAQDYQEQAIGVILSGTSSDGTLGIQAIRAEGGTTIAQEEKSAKYDGMPRSAILSECVDYILNPPAIARELARIGGLLPSEMTKTNDLLLNDGDGIGEICSLLHRVTGVDFAGYKRNTIVRRIQRQMAMSKIGSSKEYVGFLKGDRKRVEDLYRSMLILVTRFFREPEGFETLKTHVFPHLMKNRAPDDPIRIWVPGCATGEEVYSIAISLFEYLGDKSGTQAIQLFGTDISDSALLKARSGIYIENIAQDIEPHRLRRFFIKVEGGYQITKHIRDLCLFSKQDVTRDPPFSRQDVVSCRNLLIYFGSDLQKLVIPLFHYAVKPRGYLVLGNAESIGEFSNLFTLVEKQYRIYSRREVAIRGLATFPTDAYAKRINSRSKTARRGTGFPEIAFDLPKEMNRFLLNSYTPPSVAINEDLEILQVHGRTSPYLELATGKAGHNILKMAKEGLLLPLRSLIQEAKTTGERQLRKQVVCKPDGKEIRIDLEVTPIKKGVAGKDGYYAVIFHEDSERAEKAYVAPPKKGGKFSSEITELRKELATSKQELETAKEYLQSVIENQDSANEELKSANEEVLSGNEELQSTNEELETAKEELQSTNEELNTVNEELSTRNADLFSLNNDLNNFISSVQIPLVMVESDLRIRRFSPSAEIHLKLLSSDIGRPITDISLNLDFPDLEGFVLDVIHSAIPKEQEFRNRHGSWSRLHIRPYRTMDNKIDGAVIVLVDIDALKTSLEQAESEKHFSNSVIETVRSPLLVLDKQLRIKTVNQAFCEMFQVSKQETQDAYIYDLGNRQWNIPQLRRLLEDVLPKKLQLSDFDVDHNFPGVGRRVIRLNARRIVQNGRATESILISMENITDMVRGEELARSNTELKGFAYAASHDLQEPLRVISMYLDMLGTKYRGKLDSDADEYIRIAVGGARRLKNLIDDLLDYSRIGSGVPDYKSTDCSAILAQVLGDLAIPIKESGAEITHHSLPTIMVDPLQLGQVFQNLINNAIKFRSSDRAPKINVSAIDKGKFFTFSVTDNGIGFEMEQAKNIFAVFRRLHSQEEYPGTGIGLATCKRIVEGHGGSVWAESKPGEGSTFFFTIAVPPPPAVREPEYKTGKDSRR